MELDGEPWLGLVANALVGAVVHVGEERFPVVAQCGIIDSESMILACDEAVLRPESQASRCTTAVQMWRLLRNILR